MEYAAQPLTERSEPSLAVFDQAFIFAIAGFYLNSVDIYSIAGDFWFEGPPLAIDRRHHSSCSLGDNLYTFGGYSLKERRFITQIEFLNAQ